jgi:hypothetical protein
MVPIHPSLILHLGSVAPKVKTEQGVRTIWIVYFIHTLGQNSWVKFDHYLCN